MSITQFKSYKSATTVLHSNCLWLFVFFVICVVCSQPAFSEQRLSLGLITRSVTVDYANFFGLDAAEGAYVVSTTEKGSLLVGDIILKADENRIKTPADLNGILKNYKAGDELLLYVARGKERLLIPYKIKSLPVPTSAVRKEQGVTTSFDKILTVDSSSFEREVVKSDKPVLAYFYAKWCTPCNKFTPIISQIKDQYSIVKIVGIDVDKSGDIANLYGISGIMPSVILFNGGREVDKIMRVSGKDQVEKLLAKITYTGDDVEVFAKIGREAWIADARFIKGGHLLITRNDGQTIIVWDYTQGKLLKTYTAAVSEISSNGAYAVQADEKRVSVKVVKIAEQTERTIKTPQLIETLAVSPDGKYVVSFGAEKNTHMSAMVWDVNNNLIKRIPVATSFSPIQIRFAFSPDGKYFAIASSDKVEIFDTEKWENDVVFTITGSFRAFQFTPNSRYIFLAKPVQSYLFDLHTNSKSVLDSKVIGVSNDVNQVFTVNNDNSFSLLNTKTNEIVRFQGHRAPVNTVTYTTDDTWVLSGGADGTVRLWDRATGKELVQLISFANGEWIVISPEGYYNSSSRGHEYLNIRRGNKVYGIDQFYDVFYRPDIVSARLKGEDITGLVTLTVAEAIKNPPPTVKFSAVPNQTSDPKVKVCYQVQSTGGGIGEVRLFQNGKLIKSDGFYREGAAQSTTATIKLAALNSRAVYQDMRSLTVKEKQSPGAVLVRPKGELVDECVELETIAGENEISLTAFNASNTVQSMMGTARFISTKTQEEPRLYILAVGIDRYRDSSINLKYAAKDAKDFITQLADKAGTIYKPSNIHLTSLINEQASKQNILATIEKLASQVKHGDSFIFFNASHGLLLQSQYYIVTSSFDGRLDSSASLISSNEIVEVSKKIKSLSQLFIFDTCHAGGVDTIVSGLYDARMSVLAKKMGLHIYASAGSLQTALDGYQGNGLYTHTLLEGLKNGTTVDKERSGTVTVKSLGSYSKEMTTELSSKLGHPQTPLIINFGKDSRLFEVR